MELTITGDGEDITDESQREALKLVIKSLHKAGFTITMTGFWIKGSYVYQDFDEIEEMAAMKKLKSTL